MIKKSLFFFLFVTSFLTLVSPLGLFSQEGEALTKIETQKEGVISLIVYGEKKEEIGRATGFLIKEELLVTTYHSISQAKNIMGIDYTGKNIKVNGFITVNKELDLALLSLKSKNSPLKIGQADKLETGAVVYIVGGNDYGDIQIHAGKVTESTDFPLTKKLAQLNVSTRPSLSGSPVITSEGLVIGIMNVVSRSDRIVMGAEIATQLPTSGEVIKFKDWTTEDFIETWDGANFAAQAFAAIKDTSSAEKFLKKLINFKPNDKDLFFLLAQVYVDQRNYSNAVNTYQKVIELDPDHSDAAYQLGEVYFTMRNWNGAVSHLGNALRLDPQKTEAHYILGRAYKEIKDYQKAVQAFEKYVSSNPEDLKDTYASIGNCYVSLEIFDKAGMAFEKALETNPEDTQMVYQYAQALTKAKQYEKAAEIYYRLAELSPKDAQAYYNGVIRMYDEAKMPEKAAEAARKLVDLNPEDADALYNLGYMYIKMKEFNEAIKIFKEVIALRPNFEFAYSNLGFSYNQLKQYSRAVNAFSQLVQVNPDNSDAWLNMSVNYMLQKKFYEAIEPLRKTIELKPNYATAYYNLGICYLNLQDNYSAREIYMQLKKLDPALAQRLLKYFK